GETIFSISVNLIISFFVGLFAHLYYKMHESNELLKEISTIDKLTGCYNRRAYDDKIEELKKDTLDNDFLCVTIDVNGLKQVNDTLGHAAGDEIIAGVAFCLRNSLADCAEFYRIGGDEFAVFAWMDEDEIEERKIAFNDCIKNWEGKIVDEFTVSTGYATRIEFPDKSITELIRISDKRMYENKKKFYEDKNKDRRVL
nr:GGDEF domain-containing protein [Butyrivibrio sp.]